MSARPEKITMAQMRASGVRGPLVYCNDFTCSHSLAISGDQWPDDVRLSDLEPRFRCTACGKRGADVRPGLAERSTTEMRAPSLPGLEPNRVFQS